MTSVADSKPRPQNPRGEGQNRPCQDRTYTFKTEQTCTLFHLLLKKGMLKLSKNGKPEDAGRTNDPNYCLYHRNVRHPTNDCYPLKSQIQALIEPGILTLKEEQKKVSANMTTLVVGTNESPARAIPVPVGKPISTPSMGSPHLQASPLGTLRTRAMTNSFSLVSSWIWLGVSKILTMINIMLLPLLLLAISMAN